ncbi:MFS transporter [Colletotrichum truncatum]|uniref:MFS transporter n=1 Tax=Colletotrichum truncatum TaxID=5467 RepID=A0ACC3Z2D4_COLTU|nr:MFS transporter [Colletotrichum truncatum]KAF6780839.1 MFS transporter [Colletotrichum truncatum]
MASKFSHQKHEEELSEVDVVEWARHDLEKRFSIGFNPGHIGTTSSPVASDIHVVIQTPGLPQLVRPRRLMVTATLTGLLIAVLLMALDVNILATSIPKITTEFQSLRDAAWYSAAFSLARLATQPIYGRLYTLFSMKVIFCCNMATLAVGSTICAVSPNSMTLIIGRGIQGLGVSGVASGALNIGGYTVSKAQMPMMISIMSSMMMAAALGGPVLGGVFSESFLTWRFGFWLNLPLSGVSMILVWIFFPEPHRPSTRISLEDKLIRLDPTGSILILGSMTCLVLSLQWGGNLLPWSSTKVFGCLIGFGVLFLIFAFLQVKQKDKALVPVRIVKQRTVGLSCVATTCTYLGVTVLAYYVPFYLQAARGFSPRIAGSYMLALGGPETLATLVSGALITYTKHYVPMIVLGGAIYSLGSGLLSSLTTSSNAGHIIGYSILTSIGIGFSAQVPLTAVRNVLHEADIPIANGLNVFSQSLGVVLGAPIAQSVFIKTLTSRLASRLQQGNVTQITDLGAANINPAHIEPQLLSFVAEAYRDASTTSLYVAATAAAVVSTAGLFMEWKTFKTKHELES